MPEQESQEVDSQSISVTVKEEATNIPLPTSPPPPAAISEKTEEVAKSNLEETEATIATDNSKEKVEEKTPVVVVTETEEQEKESATPSTPQIVIVTEDGEQRQQEEEEQSTPELAINGEIIIDEPQTPIPTITTSDNASTATTSIEESETTILPNTTDDESSSSYSTVTPESLNDDTKPMLVDENDFKGPVIDFYKGKNILMTGITGFVGKAILWKLIQALRQDIGQIYILIRSGSIKRSKLGRPEERLRNEVFNNKVRKSWKNSGNRKKIFRLFSGILDFETYDGKSNI